MASSARRPLIRNDEQHVPSLEKSVATAASTTAAGTLTNSLSMESQEPIPSFECDARQVSATSVHASFQSRLENRVPSEYERRRWTVDDALEGRRSTSAVSFPLVAPEEPTPAEVLRDEHLVEPEILMSRLGTHAESGLPLEEAVNRLNRDGPNALTPPKRTPAIVKFLNQLFSGFAPILWVAALLCFFAWWPLSNDPLNLTLSIVLVSVILLQASFNFYQEYKSDCVMECLTAMLPANASVLRDGALRTVPVSQLVVGDIVNVGAGEKVPADLRMVLVKDMKLDKSTLNGESEPMRCAVKFTDKNIMQTRNIAFFGCSVTEGTGTGVVIATGDRTVFGEIARLAGSQTPQASTLHVEIRRFVWIIVFLSLSTGLIAFAGWAFWLRTYHPDFMPLPTAVVNCISLIVAFVPEGMPVAVTVTLALIAKDMAKNNVLVKNLGVVETLGAVSVIASDKTGTLTENKMTVSELSHKEGSPEHLELMRALVLCNRAVKHANGNVVGDASDSALLRHALAASRDDGMHEPDTLRTEWTKVAELPFNSTNKFMLSIHCIPRSKGDKMLLMKGAPERMLDRCKFVLRGHDKEEMITPEIQASIANEIQEAASRGQRILGFCRRLLPLSDFGADFMFDIDSFNFPTQDLTFVGWAALRDPPRAGVHEAISRCHSAHIRVAMVTGDMKETAQAIARQVGIISASSGVDSLDTVKSGQGDPTSCAVVLTGPELDGLDPLNWERICAYKEAVFSRTTPKQKLEIVKAYQAREECVAVTGDGVNDSPALRQADCGIAMGSGSEVSKEAADLIILDDRFTNVVLGVEHGRRCFVNLKKVIIYLLPAGSWSEMLPVMANVFLGMPLPLSSFLMIVICCCTDVGPSLAMVYEKPESTIMQVPPRRIGKDHLVTWKLLLNAYLFIGMIESAVSFATFFVYYYKAGGYTPADLILQFSAPDPELTELMNHGQCMYFYALVVMQTGNVLTSRTCNIPIWKHNPFVGPTRNLRIFAALVCSFAVMFLTCYLPPLQNSVLATRALAPYWEPLALPWLCAVLMVLINETRKAISERYPQGCMARLAWK